MDKMLKQALLFDFYGELLTEHQKSIYEDFVLNDYSLSEIGDDRVGEILRVFLVGNGVDDRYLEVYQNRKSSMSLAFLDDCNNAAYSFYKESYDKHTDWQCPAIMRDDIILFGSYYAIEGIDSAKHKRIKFSTKITSGRN